MVAADTEHPDRGLEVAERLQIGRYLRDGPVDQIARDRDQIRLLRVHQVDDRAGEIHSSRRAHVQVGHERHTHTVELGGETLQRHPNPHDPRPRRLRHPVTGGADGTHHDDGGRDAQTAPPRQIDLLVVPGTAQAVERAASAGTPVRSGEVPSTR